MPKVTHGLSKHPLYVVWQQMIQRCYHSKHKSYCNYGGRGIYVAEEWRLGNRASGNQGFANFYNWAMCAGYKPGLTLDRIDNDGPYAPWNCQWATYKVQENNKSTNRRIVDTDGSTYTFAQFARKYSRGINYMFQRLARNWSLNAIVHDLKHPEIGLRHTYRGGRYVDKDGYNVLIPVYPNVKLL
ncbi:MAG: hypothetical protein NC311_06655 [Muribaculaceae bacterium]|nr:hypothetical protein [Muribaculaceae bacterium]